MSSRLMIVAALALLGTGGGTLAGLEAASTVDGFYTAPREPKSQPMVQSASSWTVENRTYPVAPLPGMIWGQEVGRDERAYFDLPAEPPLRDEPRYVEPAVNVRRASVSEVEVALPLIDEPVASMEPVAGPVDPEDPDRLPTPDL